jgi:hypothetical protein
MHNNQEIQTMSKQTSRRHVAKPSTPGIKALITTASIAATLGGWALFANHNTSTEALLAQQATELSRPAQVFALNVSALPAIDALPTIVPRLAESGLTSQIQQPTQVPTAVPDVKQQSLRVVKAPLAVNQKPAPLTVTRSSR